MKTPSAEPWMSSEILKKLEQLCPATQPHPWREHLDLIQSGGLADASARGITVETLLGSMKIDFPGGLTSEHYSFFAPFLTGDEQATLAKGVLENLLQLCWIDWEAVLWLFRQQFGPEEDCLPVLVAAHGFDPIVAAMRDALRNYREANPRPRISRGASSRPRWNRTARLLTLGRQRWSFRADALMVFAVLDALQNNDWNDVNALPNAYAVRQLATFHDIRDAVSHLKRKTHGAIRWNCCNDGLVRCRWSN